MKTSLFAHFIKFRRGIAAVCAGLAFLMLIGHLTGGNHDETTVIVATRDLAPGTALSSDDLAEATIPTTTAWQGLFVTRTALIGRTISHAITVGQPLGRSDIVSTDLLRGLEHGTVAVELSPSQISNTSMLQAGHHIDLYATARDTEARAVLVAHDVVVLAQVNRDESGSSIDGSSTTSQGHAVMVGLASKQAKMLAATMSNYQLVAVLLNP